MKPPTLARLLARLTSDREDADFVLEDLDRRFDELARRAGAGRARRWYWSQVVRGLVWRAKPDAEIVRRRSWEGTTGDLRIGARALSRRPVYALGVVGTLALGLGSAALVSAVAWRVWLSPMPFPDPDRVVRLYETEAVEMQTSAGELTAEGRRWRIAPPLLEDMRANDWVTIQAVSGVSSDAFDWLDEGTTRRVTALKVSPEAFGILGIVPSAGRLFTEEAPFEVLLVREFWESTFGADPSVVGGHPLMLDGIAREVVGVVELPAGYPRAADIVTLLRFSETQLTEGMRGARYLDVIGRVRPGRTVAEAEAEAEAFMAALGEEYAQHEGWGADVVVLGDNLIASYRGILALLLAAGLTFLALAVVNVGGLVAARRAEAQGDRAVRLALGASEYRLLRGSVVESLLLGAVGAGAALLLARWLIAPLRALVPQDVPRLADVSLDPGLSALVVGAGLGVGVAVGLLGYAMSRGGGASLTTRRSTTAPGLRGRQYLVAGQVALTTLLTTGGVAVLRHVSELRAIDVGFEPQGVLNSPSVLSEARYPDVESRMQVWRSIEEGVSARGIDVAIAVNTPMSGSNMPYGFRVDASAEQDFAQYHTVSDDYFDVMGIEVLDGRTFGPDDHSSSAQVIVVNEAFQRQHFPAGAVGREMLMLNQTKTIVGVVAPTRHFGPDAEAPLEMYTPLEQDPWYIGTVIMKTDRADAVTVLADVVDGIDQALGVPPAEPYTAYLDEWYAPLRLQIVMVGGLALLGLTLASLGLYALVAYHVSTRRREIGIRIALGAPTDRVFRSVMGQGALLGVVGGIVGLGAWYLLAPKLRELVEGIDPSDLSVPLLVALVVGGACMAATLAPAWRSTSVDPVATLKAE